MQTFTEWLLSEKKVELVTCTKKMVKIPKGENEKEFLTSKFANESKKKKK